MDAILHVHNTITVCFIDIIYQYVNTFFAQYKIIKQIARLVFSVFNNVVVLFFFFFCSNLMLTVVELNK